ncbi:MAG TPA: hypothetical protein VGJ53_16520 [Micromonosporaceae bacterium]
MPTGLGPGGARRRSGRARAAGRILLLAGYVLLVFGVNAAMTWLRRPAPSGGEPTDLRSGAPARARGRGLEGLDR